MKKTGGRKFRDTLPLMITVRIVVYVCKMFFQVMSKRIVVIFYRIFILPKFCYCPDVHSAKIILNLLIQTEAVTTRADATVHNSTYVWLLRNRTKAL